MKTLLAAMLLTAGLGFGQVSVGIRIGPPPAPRVVRVRPVAPRTRLFLGGWLLVSQWEPLPLA